MNKPPDDLQQIGGREHVGPEVGGGVFIQLFGDLVARTAIPCAAVEGQEMALVTGQAGGHVDRILTDRKVNKGAALKGEQRFGLVGDRVFGQAGAFVLLDRPFDCLFELALELQGDDRDAVEKEHEIDAPRLGLLARGCEMGGAGVGTVDQFGHDAQNVAFIHRQGLRVEIMVGLELAELEGD